MEGERGIILGEEKCTPRAKRGGVVYGFSNGERVVAGCHRHDYPNKLYRYQGGGEGETRADYREIEPRALVGGPLFIITLNFSFHSCAGIILRRDVEGGGEKIRRLNDSDRSLTRYGEKRK